MAYEGIAHAVGFTVNAVKETSLVAWNWTQAHRAQAAVNAVKETSLVAWDRAQAHPAQAAVDAVKETSLMAWDWAQAHPAQAAVTTVSVTLTPFFGFGWMFGLLARLLGFGKVGVGAGRSCSLVSVYVVLIYSRVRDNSSLVANCLWRIRPSWEHLCGIASLGD